MLSQIKNIFFVANDLKKSTEEFSLFFAKKPYFKGFSKELGIRNQKEDLGQNPIGAEPHRGRTYQGKGYFKRKF